MNLTLGRGSVYLKLLKWVELKITYSFFFWILFIFIKLREKNQINNKHDVEIMIKWIVNTNSEKNLIQTAIIINGHISFFYHHEKTEGKQGECKSPKSLRKSLKLKTICYFISDTKIIPKYCYYSSVHQHVLFMGTEMKKQQK